jgi:tRNA(fMet)-specific endonuclease VapC
MPFLLDSDWVIQALAGRAPAVPILRRMAPSLVALSVIVLGEIYERAYASSNPEAHIQSFRAFWQPYRLIGLDEATMQRFAEIRSLLRRRGELIPDMDLLIAATALRHNLTLLTFNLRHFRRIPDLQLYELDRGSLP